MDFPIIIIYVSPLLFLGTSSVILNFSFAFFMKANSKAPYGTTRFVASHPGLNRLPMSNKKDDRLIFIEIKLSI